MTPFVGQTFSEKHLLAQDEFDRFAALSGDDNPIHVDPEFSARTRFGKTVAHGMFLYSLICGVLAKHLPNASQVGQDLMFPAPSYVGRRDCRERARAQTGCRQELGADRDDGHAAERRNRLPG